MNVNDGIRDERFMRIVKNTLGENGFAIIINISLLFILAIIFIMMNVLAFITSTYKNHPKIHIDEPLLVSNSVKKKIKIQP